MRHVIASLSFLVLLLVGAGCQQTNPAPRPGLADPYPAPYNSPDITVVDEDLRQWLGFQPAVRVRTTNQPLHVEVPVRNLADDQYIIQYRFLFYDERDVEQDPIMGWRRAVLEPKQTVRLEGSALDASAKSYKLQVRWAR